MPPWVVSALWFAAALSASGKVAFRRFFSAGHTSAHELLIKEVDWQSHATNIVNGLQPDRLILMVRHPCGVVNSRVIGVRLEVIHDHQRAEWLQANAAHCAELGYSRGTVWAMNPWEFYALDWLIQNLNYRKLAVARAAVQVVVYEQLCDDPVQVAKEVFSFLGWQVNPETLRFIKTSTSSGFRQMLVQWAGKRRTYYGLYRNSYKSTAAWKQVLTVEQQRQILRIASRFPQMDWWDEHEPNQKKLKVIANAVCSK